MSEFNESIMFFASYEVDPELISERRDRITEIGDLQDAPQNMTMMPSVNLSEYQKLMADHNCDYIAVSAFVKLATKGPRGFMEATRVIHHFIKDKVNLPPKEPWTGPGPDTRNSRWMKNACERASDAIDDPEPWNSGDPSLTASGPGASKGSYDAQKGACMGKGKSKDKGKFMTQYMQWLHEQGGRGDPDDAP